MKLASIVIGFRVLLLFALADAQASGAAASKPEGSKAAVSVPEAPAPAAKMSAAAADRAALQGEWTLISVWRDGQDFGAIPGSRRIAKGDTTTVIIAGQILMRATFKVDPSKTPKGIDYHVVAGANANADLLGIYALTDSTVTFCFASPAKPRPAEFVTKAGDGTTCSTWKRAPRQTTAP